MLLTFDIGNSHSVAGLWHERELVQTLRLTTEPQRTADEWYLLLKMWLSGSGKELAFKSAAVSSVVPAANAALKEAFEIAGIENPFWLGASSPLNFTFDYPSAQSLGADRLADAIAAVFYYGPNVVVVDFGTAITFSVVTEKIFQGGVIAPGITSSLESLFNATAKLPKMAFKRTTHAWGKTTGESIEIGAYIGWRGVVREILAEIKNSLPRKGQDHKVIATGGIAESLDFAPEFFDSVDKNLTLRGLYLAATQVL